MEERQPGLPEWTIIDNIRLEEGLIVDFCSIAGHVEHLSIKRVIMDSLGRTICVVSHDDRVIQWASVMWYRITPCEDCVSNHATAVLHMSFFGERHTVEVCENCATALLARGSWARNQGVN